MIAAAAAAVAAAAAERALNPKRSESVGSDTTPSIDGARPRLESEAAPGLVSFVMPAARRGPPVCLTTVTHFPAHPVPQRGFCDSKPTTWNRSVEP